MCGPAGRGVREPRPEGGGETRAQAALTDPIRPGPDLGGRGRLRTGQVNFLFDSSTKPYATADDLSAAFGVAKSTLGAKAKQVRDLTKMDYGTPEFLREDIVDSSPMTWFIQVDGLIVDARELPPQVQAQAFDLGVIPYIPALGRDGTAEWLRQTRRA